MGIDAELAARNHGNPIVVSDSQGVFARFVSGAPFHESVCIRFIDPYGDTIFNSLQLPVLLEELDIVHRNASASDLRLHVGRLIDLVKQAIARGPHAFVKFVGD